MYRNRPSTLKVMSQRSGIYYDDFCDAVQERWPRALVPLGEMGGMLWLLNQASTGKEIVGTMALGAATIAVSVRAMVKRQRQRQLNNLLEYGEFDDDDEYDSNDEDSWND
jgi:hypothetical protein